MLARRQGSFLFYFLVLDGDDVCDDLGRTVCTGYLQS